MRKCQFLVAVAIAVVASGCFGQERQLRARIAAAVAQGDGAVINMADITPFSWDRLHVFPPYTSAEQIDKDLGFRWRGAHRIEMHDSFTLLVFAAGGHVIAFVEQPRAEGDFSQLYQRHGYTPSAARFVVDRERDGWPVLRLVPSDASNDAGALDRLTPC